MSFRKGVCKRGMGDDKRHPLKRGEGGDPRPLFARTPLPSLWVVPFAPSLAVTRQVKHFTNKVTFHSTGKSQLPVVLGAVGEAAAIPRRSRQTKPLPGV